MEDCVTFFARWAYEHPQSLRGQTVLAEVRQSSGIRLSKIGEVRELFEGKSGASALPLARASALTDLYATYYNHVVPFEEDAFDAIWSRCRDLRCGEARRKAEAVLQGGSSTLPALDQRDARGDVARSPEPSPATPDLSPAPESD